MSLMCAFIALGVYLLRRASAPSSTEFYASWTLLILCNYRCARSRSSFGDSADVDYSQAYKATKAIGLVQQMTWVLVTSGLVVGLVFAGAEVSSVLRLFVAPLLLFVPICLFANLLSLLVVCELHDFRFIGYRLTSIAATVVPAVWVMVETNR